MSGSITSTFSCGLIGGNHLTVQCGDYLLSRGHIIKWVLPRGKMLTEWAQRNNITQYFTQQEIIDAADTVDYIFSVVNDLILSPALLAIPEKFAINYHNALLPKYGGVFATSWAILNDETSHGITWHIVRPAIDTGEILNQQHIHISPTDTAYALNQRCYEVALQGFRESLVPDLEKNNIQPIVQDESQRSYYTLYRKPPYGGLLRWDMPVTFLYKLYRALSRGNIDNSFEHARIVYNDKVFSVHHLHPLTADHRALPGTILNIDADGMTVAVQDAALSIQQLQGHDGEMLTAAAWCKAHQLERGNLLPLISSAIGDALQSSCESVSKDENFCIAQWKQAFAISQLEYEPIQSQPSSEIPITSFVDTALVPVLFMLAVSSLYGKEIPVLYATQTMHNRIVGMETFFNAGLPVVVPCYVATSIHQQVDFLKNVCQKVEKRGIYGADIFVRRKINRSNLPLSITISDEGYNTTAAIACVNIIYHPANNTFRIAAKRNALEDLFNCDQENFAIAVSQLVHQLSLSLTSDKNV
ncbi:formyltransferase family protein [Chitinophaga sp. Hz27]|uniref:formyltransferase family protein n=1 Tax=Chitinophaga sp. Hz27 TaxID=3347169 RepID=UPI0035E1E1EE